MVTERLIPDMLEAFIVQVNVPVDALSPHVKITVESNETGASWVLKLTVIELG
jgi:hypothetical protein